MSAKIHSSPELQVQVFVVALLALVDEAEAEYGDLPISDDHRHALLEVRKRKTADLTQEQQDQKQKRKFGQLRPS